MIIKMNCTLIIFVSSVSLQNVDLFVGSAQDQEHRRTGTSSSSRRSSQRRAASLCASRTWCPTRLRVSFVLRVCVSGTRRWRLLCSSSSKRSNRYLTVYHKGQLEDWILVRILRKLVYSDVGHYSKSLLNRNVKVSATALITVILILCSILLCYQENKNQFYFPLEAFSTTILIFKNRVRGLIACSGFLPKMVHKMH